MNNYTLSLFILHAVVSVSSGCDETSSVLGAQAKEAVTLVVPIETRRFAERAILQVRLWNAEQLEAMDRNASCATEYNPQTQTQEIRCPEGIEYQEVTPEEICFPVETIVASLEVRSETIRVGQNFRIVVSGLSQDECNRTSADLKSIAASHEFVLERLVWQTTARACREN